MEFIMKSRDLVETKEDFDNPPIEAILTDEIQQEILRIRGPEFDLYLKGLRYRNFDSEKKMFWWKTTQVQLPARILFRLNDV